MNKFCGDPGHGGSDPGAVGNGVIEKDWNLNFIKLVRTKLEAGYDARMVFARGNDKYVANGIRDDIARMNNCQGFISIHINSATDPNANGFESFRHPNAPSSVAYLQKTMHNEIMAYLKQHGIKDRGTKIANFQVLRENTYASMPAVLFENLFLSNPSEAKLLKDSKFVDGLADAYVRGIVSAFNLAPRVDKDLVDALELLRSQKFINSPAYWLANAVEGGQCNGKYVATLIKNVASKLK